ncbi:copper homeostasis protein CutC [Roseibium alexandrii]|uniref:PF03932 family protein CutC n=1 Tax=Roseibium alexandrii TaxID=388408 RepID=A0A0M6ZVT2_9HYPH|nr:copper homeostasis protein CutC [Roseibium alexandrii]CTQ65634.1 Copper homeostasis protein CutC [Roseibium alexandrii]
MLLEVCVDTMEGAWAAVRGGAGRIELCSALSEGGLTPSAGLMRAAAKLPVPVYAMIRPRAGHFRFSEAEEEIMASDIKLAKDFGLSGVVLGAQHGDHTLDRDMLARLSDRAAGLGRTLHRVIDVVPDPFAALETAIDLGFERVLTSGGQATANAGQAVIREMAATADFRIGIMPGAGLRPDLVANIIQSTGVTEVHASCSVIVIDEDADGLFCPPGGCRKTSEDLVKQMVAAIGNSGC